MDKIWVPFSVIGEQYFDVGYKNTLVSVTSQVTEVGPLHPQKEVHFRAEKSPTMGRHKLAIFPMYPFGGQYIGSLNMKE